MGKAVPRSAGSNVGVKIEGNPQFGRNIDAAFRAPGIIGMGDGPEQDAVGLTAALQHRSREGGTSTAAAEISGPMPSPGNTTMRTAIPLASWRHAAPAVPIPWPIAPKVRAGSSVGEPTGLQTLLQPWLPVTTDHNTIRKSAEYKRGKPAAVKPTHRGGGLGIVRIMVPDRPQSDDKDLVGISWEESASRSGRTAIAACCWSKKSARPEPGGGLVSGVRPE